MSKPLAASSAETPDLESGWIKSSLSFALGNCVEVSDLPDGRVGVRHSKQPQAAVLRFTPAEWLAFTGGVRAGEFDAIGGHGSP